MYLMRDTTIFIKIKKTINSLNQIIGKLNKILITFTTTMQAWIHIQVI